MQGGDTLDCRKCTGTALVGALEHKSGAAILSNAYVKSTQAKKKEKQITNDQSDQLTKERKGCSLPWYGTITTCNLNQITI